VSKVLFGSDSGKKHTEQQASADRSDQTSGQKKKARNDNRNESRENDLLVRIRAKTANCVELFGHSHRPQLSRSECANFTAEHERNEKRTDLSNRAARCKATEKSQRTERLNLKRELNGHHCANEKASKSCCAKTLDRDSPNLREDFVSREWAQASGAQCFAKKKETPSDIRKKMDCASGC
jgi:hypothetical protein